MAAALLAGAYLLVRPTGADLPAQLLRVRLFATAGPALWDNWWYGGHYLLGYSVLFPPLGWLLGARLLAALAAVGTAAAFEALAHDHFGDDAWLGSTWLGAATVTELLSGRLTFMLGLCAAAYTALLLQRRRPRWAAVLAAVTALSSPVAGLLAALAGAVAAWPGSRTAQRARLRGGLATIAVEILVLAAIEVAFPTPGYQPFALGTLWPLLVAGAGLALLARRGRHDTLALAILLYVLGCVAAFAVHTPLGGNAARLGELTAGPLAALLLTERRALRWLALVALPLVYIQAHDAATDLQKGWRSPYDGAAYYRPLIRFLGARPGAEAHAWRVEVPFTAGHWEAYRLAPAFALARGWERQLDIADDPLFYGAALTPAAYEAWLDRLAVRYVAVPDAPADYSARGERALIARGLPYLRRVATLPHWTVYAVRGAPPIVTGAGRMLSMGQQRLTIAVAHPGIVAVRVRWSPYWRVAGIRGCVEPDGAFTRILARERGRARLEPSFALGRIGSRAPRCD